MTKNKLLRVTQMNAIYLDKEVYNLFIHTIQEASKYLPAGLTSKYESEINLFVRMAILKYSIMKNGSTFGQQLLSIKYENMTMTKKFLCMLCNTLEYVKAKYEQSSSTEQSSVIFKLYTVIKFLEFLNLSIFLRNGVKPLLIERFLNLNQVYASDTAHRHFESKYLARELLWNGFIEIIVNVLPLINFYKLKRVIKHINPFYKRPTYASMADRVITVHTKCAHCNEEPPILPHHMGCEHIFCYVCLKGNQMADPKYECPICEHRNYNILCDRVSVM